MFSLERSQGYETLLYIVGIVLVLGRFVHARGILTETLKLRVVGMMMTFSVLIGLSLCNVAYFCMSYFSL